MKEFLSGIFAGVGVIVIAMSGLNHAGVAASSLILGIVVRFAYDGYGRHVQDK